MLLPKGKKEMGRPEVGPGFYPPLMHQLSVPEDPEQWNVDPSYSMTHSVEAMAKVKGIGRGKKYNLMAQVIPIYGFGILLYIFYIIYKLTCRGKANKSGPYTAVTKAKMENKIPPDYELIRLQERLLRTEEMMERIVSGKSRGSGRLDLFFLLKCTFHCPGGGRRRKSKSSTSKKEEKLLRQLRQITMLMQEGRLEAASPEIEAEEVPYCEDWEGYPEETYPEYDEPCRRRGFNIFTLEEPPHQPTAEALAERMLQEEEELTPAAERKQERLGLEVSKELQCLSGGRKQISFSEHKDVFHYPKEGTYEEEEEEKEEEVEEEDEGTEVEEDEGTEVEEEEEADEDDPVMEAENLLFSSEGCPNPEEEAEKDEEEYMLEPVEGGDAIQADMPKEVGTSGLRMRNRRET
ncbi:hypothetical protein ABVT39_015980 [Epinephelus coioides]